MSHEASLPLAPFSGSAPATPTDRARRPILGWVVTALPVLFMLFDGIIKVALIAPVRDASELLGYDPAVMPALGIVILVSVALYLVPRTSVLGAILLTGYLGGAVATHVRVGTAYWFPILVGALFWAGLALRDARVRSVLLAPSSR